MAGIQYLKHNTASQIVRIGPLMTTAGAPATGLTLANTDIKIIKKGGTTLVNKNSGGATEISQGVYYCTFDATDTNTLGDGDIHINKTGAMPWSGAIEVLHANVYESLHGANQQEFLEICSNAPDMIVSGGNLDSYKRDNTTLQRSKPATFVAAGSANVLTQLGS